jgi:large subunit ribosomal protein L18
MAKKTRGQARRMRHRRVRRQVLGTSERPRLNVFRSLKHIYAQVVDDTQGHTIVAASTLDQTLVSDLEGKSPVERAELVGRLVAERARGAGIQEVVFDRSGYRYHGRVKALAEGAREGGLEF